MTDHKNIRLPNEKLSPREIDAQIAAHVMGLLQVQVGHSFSGRHPRYRYVDVEPNGNAVVREIPYYSTDIAAAFTVVDRMKTLGVDWDHGIPLTDASIARAICLAALKAVGQ